MRLVLLFYGLFITCSIHSQEIFTLDAFITEVLEEDFGIKIMKNEVEIATNENNIGAAGYLPRISLEGRRNINVINAARQEFISGQITEVSDAVNRDFDAGVLMEWTIFDGFKMFATDKKLDLLEESAQLNLKAEMEMKIYQASIAFYSFLLLQNMQSVLEESISLSQMRYDYIENRFQNGASSQLELVQAQLDLTADSAAYLNNEREIEEVATQMNTLLARSVDTPISLNGELPSEAERIIWENLKEQAERQNTAILLAKSNIAIREKEHKEVVSRFYPQLGFYASYNLGTAKNEVGFLLNNRIYGPSFGLSLRWDILDQLSRYQGLKNIKIQEKNAQLIEEQEKIMVNAALRDAFNSYEWARKNMSFELRNQLAAEEIAHITENAFNFGAITPLELREIQFGIIEAKSRLLATQLEYITAKLNIALTTGDLKKMIE